MIEIYFDGILLDNSNYMGFDVSFQPFDKEFYLGSTGSITASLTIPKGALPASLNKVQIKINNQNWYSCVVDAIEENDNEEYVLTLMDSLTHTEIGYDFSDKVPITAKTLLENICNDFEIPHDEFNFTNQEVTINSYDSTLTAREYISMIAELAGGYASINSDGKFEIKTYLDSIGNNIIRADEVDTFKIRNTVTIERVVWQFVSEKKESSSDDSLYTVYLDGNNMFLENITDEIFENICNNIIGFTFSSIKINTTNKFFNDKNTIIFIDRDEKEYNILPFFEASYNGGLVGSYDSNLENAKQNETRVKSTTQKTKRIKQEVDQNANTLSIAIEDINTQKNVTNPGFNDLINANTSLIQQTADSIRYDVTETETRLRTDIDNIQEDVNEVEDALQEQITENKSSIAILSQSITSTVKSIGGNNLLRNSVGFAKTRKTRKSKNLLDSSTMVQGDIANGNVTVRLSTRQEIYLEAGTYTFSTDLSSSYQFSLTVQDVSLPPLSALPSTYILNTSWNPVNTTVKTFTISNPGWFNLWLKRADNGTITLTEIKNYRFQLVTGSTAINYEEYGAEIFDYESLDFWNTEESRVITSVQDAETESSTLSGSKIVISNIGKMEQEFITIPNLTYGVSLKLKHIVNGGTANSVKITIVEGTDEVSVLTTDQETREYVNFMQLSEFTYLSKTGNPKLVIETNGDDLIEISDLIISQGENQAWSSYFDEVYGKEHRLDKYGLRLTDLGTGDYSEQSINSLKFVDDDRIVSEISRNQVKSDAGRFNNEITIRRLQWIALDDDNIIEYIN